MATILDENGKRWAIGRVSKRLRECDQVPGDLDAICHACGLGYKCWDEDCPNDRTAPEDSGLFWPTR